MKIAIISDIHANWAALQAFPEKKCDQIWCLGDLVDYGPRPREVIHWIEANAKIAVRGNHDHAVGFDADPRCSLPYKHLASETMHYTRNVCTEADLEFLRNLPVQREFVVDGKKVYAVHAAPTDPLFAYLTKDSDLWEREAQWTDANVLIVGHTHTPFIREAGGRTVVNPGSLGQPKTGRPLACYALWEDGAISLKEYSYPLEETFRQLRQMPLSKHDIDELIAVLKSGGSAIPTGALTTQVHNRSL